MLGARCGATSWKDKYLGPQPLLRVFPELYNLSAKPDLSVEEMSLWSEGSWTWDLRIDGTGCHTLNFVPPKGIHLHFKHLYLSICIHSLT